MGIFANQAMRERRVQMMATARKAAGLGVVVVPPSMLLPAPTTFSIPRGARNREWDDRFWERKRYESQYEYAKARAGVAEGFGWDDLRRLFGNYVVEVVPAGTNIRAVYLGNNQHVSAVLAERWNKDGVYVATPKGVRYLDPHLYQGGVEAGGGDPRIVALSYARIAEMQLRDRELGLVRDCAPFGSITRQQAAFLLPRHEFSQCLREIAALRDPPGSLPCPEGYSKAVRDCPPGQEVVSHSARGDCNTCKVVPCPEDYRRHFPTFLRPGPSCPTGFEVVTDSGVPGCYRCARPECPVDFLRHVPTLSQPVPGCPDGYAVEHSEVSGCYRCVQVQPSQEPDAQPDVQPDAQPDVQPDAEPEVTPGDGEEKKGLNPLWYIGGGLALLFLAGGGGGAEGAEGA